MPRQLTKLLKSYEFLQSALKQHGPRMSRKEAAGIESSMDELFLRIIGHHSQEPQITLAQARFLLANIDKGRNPRQADALREACDNQLQLLESQVIKLKGGRAGVAALNFGLLDSLSDRVSVLDRNYRYVFTNKANADFHNEPQKDFIGRPNWLVTSRRFFEAITKPKVDACLAGHRVSLTIPHPNRPTSIFTAVFDPIRASDGSIDGIISVSHDVTQLIAQPTAVTPLP